MESEVGHLASEITGASQELHTPLPFPQSLPLLFAYDESDQMKGMEVLGHLADDETFLRGLNQAQVV